MPAGEDHRQLTGRAAHIAQSLVLGEVEGLGQGVEAAHRCAGHGVHELLQTSGVAVQLVEHRPAGVLDLVLRLTCLQRLGEVAPEPVQPGVAHLQHTADVGRAGFVEKCCRLRGVGVAGVRAVAVADQHPPREKGVGEVRHSPRVQAQPVFDLARRQRGRGQVGEQLQLDRRQQRLGGHETLTQLHDLGRVKMIGRHSGSAGLDVDHGEWMFVGEGRLGDPGSLKHSSHCRPDDVVAVLLPVGAAFPDTVVPQPTVLVHDQVADESGRRAGRRSRQ